MSKHSTIVGGSTAGRLINCPASLGATRALPPTADAPSEYANEGTALHAVMDTLMRQRLHDEANQIYIPMADPQSLVGMTFHDREFTQEHHDTMVAPALDGLAWLEEHYGARFEVLGVETRVRFPDVIGAFGTVDLILANDDFTILLDWKFGQGVGVAAVYSDGEGAVVNPQLMYYLSAAMRTKPRWFAKRRLVVAIVQPRGAQPLTYTEVARGEVKIFNEDLHNAVLAALDRDPPRRKGEWCRFAPCKISCPLWTGPLLDLAFLEPLETPVGPPVAAAVTPYGTYLARAKMLVDTVVLFKKELDEQMHAYLTAGGSIPGWRLKAKSKPRQWVDEKVVNETLARMGFPQEEIWQRKLATFQSIDAYAKRKGVTIPEHLRVAPATTETTLATTDDPAPVVDPAKQVEQFSASLRSLLQPGQE